MAMTAQTRQANTPSRRTSRDATLDGYATFWLLCGLAAVVYLAPIVVVAGGWLILWRLGGRSFPRRVYGPVMAGLAIASGVIAWQHRSELMALSPAGVLRGYHALQVEQARLLWTTLRSGGVVERAVWETYARAAAPYALPVGTVAAWVLAALRPSWLSLSRYGALAEQTQPTQRSALKLIDAGKLAKSKASAVRWYVPGLVGSGVLTIVGAAPKRGKTTWTFGLLRACQDEQLFMGLQAKSVRALYCTEETSPNFGGTIRRFGIARRTLESLSHHTVSGWSWDALVPEIGRMARAKRCGLVVIDTLATWQSQAERQPESVEKAMTPLRKLTADGLAVLVIHHDRKAGGEGGTALRGSSALAAAVDIIVDLDRDNASGVVTISTYGRHGELSLVSRLDGVRYVPIGAPVIEPAAEPVSKPDVAPAPAPPPPSVEPPAPTLSAELEQTLAFLRGRGDTGAMGAEIMAVTHVSKAASGRRLNALKTAGLVMSEPMGRNALRWRAAPPVE